MKIFSSQKIPRSTERKHNLVKAQVGYQKNKQKCQRETNFSVKKRHAMEEMNTLKSGEEGWTTSVVSPDTPLQYIYDSRIATSLFITVVFYCFSLQTKDPWMKGNYKIYSNLHYINHINKRLKCNCLLQSDWGIACFFSCCLPRVSWCINKNYFAF